MAGSSGNINILNAINQIIVAINDQKCGCCGGGSGSGGGGSGGGGAIVDAPPATEGTTPPPGSSPPNNTITDRKCIAANMLIDDLVKLLDYLRINRVDQLAKVSMAIAVPMMVYALGLMVATAGAAAIVGLVGGAIAALVATQINFTLILSVLATERQALICILFNSTGAAAARTAFIAHLETNGLSTPEGEFIRIILLYKSLNILFFATGDSEAKIKAYTATTTCKGCKTCIWEIVPGQGTGTIDQTGIEFTLSSEPLNTPKGVFQYIQIQETLDCCPTNGTIELVSWAGVTPKGFGVWVWNGCPGTRSTTRTEGVGNLNPIAGQRKSCNIGITSSTPFTATFKVL